MNDKQKVLCFGELLLRICPDVDGKWLRENQLSFYVGGAELNVAQALALWKIPTKFLTAIPKNEMTDQILSYLNNKNIDTSDVIFSGQRLGLYFLTKGKDLKNASVIYDRAYSSFSKLDSNSIDWDGIFEDVSWFHYSAICPALNPVIAKICLEAVKIAKQKNIYVSLDLNYRPKLWTYTDAPEIVMKDLAPYCDLIMGNIWSANKLLGTHIPDSFLQNELISKEILLEQSEITSKEIIATYPNCRIVANTFRFSVGDGIKYYTTLFKEGNLYVSKEWNSDKIVDKVGSGDCFMAGLIYGIYSDLSSQNILEYATAAAFDKLFILNDATTSSIEHIDQLIKK